VVTVCRFQASYDVGHGAPVYIYSVWIVLGFHENHHLRSPAMFQSIESEPTTRIHQTVVTVELQEAEIDQTVKHLRKRNRRADPPRSKWNPKKRNRCWGINFTLKCMPDGPHVKEK
jgi:hypothetical protein